LAFLVTPLSMVASVILLVSLLPVGLAQSRPPRPSPLRLGAAAALAVLSLVLQPVFLLMLGGVSSASSAGPPALLGGAGAFLVSSILFAAPSSRDD